MLPAASLGASPLRGGLAWLGVAHRRGGFGSIVGLTMPHKGAHIAGTDEVCQAHLLLPRDEPTQVGAIQKVLPKAGFSLQLKRS